MAKRGRKKKEKSINIHSEETKIIFGLIFVLIGITVLISPFFDNRVFRYVSETLGFGSVIWGIATIYLSLRFFINRPPFNSIKFQIGLILFAITFSTFLVFWTPIEMLKPSTDFSTSGGHLGYLIHNFLFTSVGKLVEFLTLIATFIISISLLTSIKLTKIRDFVVNSIPTEKEQEDELKQLEKRLNIDTPSNPESDLDIDAQPEKKSFLGLFSQKDKTEIIEPEPELVQMQPSDQKVFEKKEEGVDDTPRYPNWKFPAVDLLQDPILKPQNKEIYKRNALIIERTLESFGVQSRVVEVLVGPTVVQYALSIGVGQKVSKIQNLANDLALALAAPASSVRIQSPIPGTSLVGIEVPNPTPNFVYVKELIQKLLPEKSKYELPLVLGKDIAGKMIMKDLASMPHLLVAGATGTGKSVGINAMLISLLMTKSPDEMKLILVDPKMVEMSPYNGIPHLLTPVITDMELVFNALQWAIEEMGLRYRMLKQAGVRKVSEYNQKMGYSAMPYIVIVVDEMADLMLSTGIDVETKIVRLAQMSRAVGIHLILATQRPSVNVVTGLIKANIPARVAFSVASGTDSRVIIDQVGAETLIGNGDMLFKSPSDIRPLRIQGAYSDIKDLDRVIKFIKDQTQEVAYSEEIIAPRGENGQKIDGESGSSEDPMYIDALNTIINAQKASASLLQRKLRIGYNRAARLIDELEVAGVIGEQDGSNSRKVLVTSIDQVRGK